MQSSQVAPPSSPSEDRAVVRRRIQRALSFTRGHRRGVIGTLCISVTVACVTAVEPVVMRRLIDGLSHHEGVRILVIGAAILALLLAVREALGAFGNWLGWRTRLGVQRALLDATI